MSSRKSLGPQSQIGHGGLRVHPKLKTPRHAKTDMTAFFTEMAADRRAHCPWYVVPRASELAPRKFKGLSAIYERLNGPFRNANGGQVQRPMSLASALLYLNFENREASYRKFVRSALSFPRRSAQKAGRGFQNRF